MSPSRPVRPLVAPRVISISVTEAGRKMAARLPYGSHHGDAARTVASLWDQVDAFVLFLAVGAAVRIAAPLLESKEADPAIVCVDEAGRFAVALIGGHHGRAVSANNLARTVARTLGAEAVVTTATDAAGIIPLDDLPGLQASGDIAAVSRALLDGGTVSLVNEAGWPLPASLASATCPDGRDVASVARIVVSDRLGRTPGQATVVLRPPSLVAGVGADTGCTPEELMDLFHSVLTQSGLAASCVAEIATLDRRAGDTAVAGLAAALGVPVRSFRAESLAAVQVPHPSPVVARATGTPSVAEAAALAAAGAGGCLAVAKERSAHCTVAVARRSRPRGSVTIVGLGPGASSHRSPAAESAVRRSEVVIGYEPYVARCSDLLGDEQVILPYPIGEEIGRARRAVAEAVLGRRVAVVCSGDPGVFAMAAMVLAQVTDEVDIDAAVVPGITAAHAAAAVLGAPLAHDHAVVSLSDLTTPWETIAARVDALARAGLAIAFYNPRSSRRDWQLSEALRILERHRSPDTPVGIVTDAMRPGQSATVVPLGRLVDDPHVIEEVVTMTTCVIVGAPDTSVVGGRMVTPRGRPVR